MVIAFALAAGRDKGPAKTVTTQPNGALPQITVSAPPANTAADAGCTKLLGVLPVDLDSLQARPVASTSPYIVAWGEPAVVLRCGVPRPAALVPDSDKIVIAIPAKAGTVNWLPVNDPKQKKPNVFTTVDRSVYIEVSVPVSYRQPPLATLTAAIVKVLPAVCEIQPADLAKSCTRRR